MYICLLLHLCICWVNLVGDGLVELSDDVSELHVHTAMVSQCIIVQVVFSLILFTIIIHDLGTIVQPTFRCKLIEPEMLQD